MSSGFCLLASTMTAIASPRFFSSRNQAMLLLWTSNSRCIRAALRAAQFLFTTAPLMGVNPPKPASRPPLRSDVACETQQPPDLRTVPGNPPSGFKVDTTSPAALALQDASAEAAAKWVRRLIRRNGLEHLLDVTDRPLRADQIPLLRSAAPRP